MQQFAYSKEKIYTASNLGLDIITSYYPDAENAIGKTNHAFKTRDEKSASSYLWFSKDQNTWCVKDFGDNSAINSIDVCIKEDNLTFAEACKKWAVHYGIAIVTPENYKPEIKFSTAEKGVTTENFDIKYADQIPEAALKMIGVHVTQEICDKYDFRYVTELTTYFVNKNTKVLTRLVKKPTENYPIFAFYNKTWVKTYEPLADKEKKHPRFLYFGKKPARFIVGLDSVVDRVEDKRNANDNEKIREEDIKLDNVIMVSGGSDGLNVASMNPDYNVIWFNSESDQIRYEEYADLKKDTKAVYYLPDLDDTGVKQAIKLGNMFLGIKHIWLPETLKMLKDKNGNPCKDVRDYIEKYYRKNEPEQIKKQFNKLFNTALPFQFWDAYKQKEVWQYKFNSTHAFHFLKHQGFSKIADVTEKTGFSLIRVIDNKVTKLSHVDIKDFINDFLENQNSPIPLRNMIYDTTKLTDKHLGQLSYKEIDFTDASQTNQYLFFKNCSWNITADKIIKIDNSRTKKMVWADKVLEHNVKIQEPHFKINATDSEKCTIDVLKKDNKFFNYLINSSRVYWRDELEKPFINSAGEIDHKAKDAYFKTNQFNIKGSKLTAEQQQEQQQHLVNKIYAFGYFLHKYKDDSNSYFVYAMDNKITELDESHGGSGKSIMWSRAIREVYKRIKTLDGKNKETLEDKFALDGVTPDTDAIIIDDTHAFFNIERYFSIITSSTVVNPKNNKPFEIPFEESPKIVATSNYQLKNLDTSTLRRLLFTVFSDYYHFNKGGGYLEHRKVSDDFNGENLFTHFNETDWNDFYNFVAYCIQFYLGQKQTISPPMENVIKRNLLRIAGDTFTDWADVYFNENPDKLNKYISKKELFDEYENHAGKRSKTSNNFKKSLAAWCNFMGFDFQPLDKIPIDSQGKHRKIMKIDGAVSRKSQEALFIALSETQHNQLKESAGEELDTNVFDFPES